MLTYKDSMSEWTIYNVPQCRIHEAINAGATVVDVDGSYLYKKHKTLTEAGHRLAPLTPPAPPPSGWVTVSSENYLQVAPDLPTVTAGQYTIKKLSNISALSLYTGVVYTYLAGHVGQVMKQPSKHWHVDTLIVHLVDWIN